MAEVCQGEGGCDGSLVSIHTFAKSISGFGDTYSAQQLLLDLASPRVPADWRHNNRQTFLILSHRLHIQISKLVVTVVNIFGKGRNMTSVRRFGAE